MMRCSRMSFKSDGRSYWIVRCASHSNHCWSNCVDFCSAPMNEKVRGILQQFPGNDVDEPDPLTAVHGHRIEELVYRI
eukprot:CAMPEP_0168805620 /NCGR_PEP_ID=MMETSP0726-20121227/1124_1 /TAXON_ID=265536 /ORGANISM="Amphiprora sp., Strain CCMP467" /LENGTH=77 /DNA_ID=CAMNT_0008857499 /DNA_START=45 /DNA_END=278 /DNA_ORIENTATION=-